LQELIKNTSIINLKNDEMDLIKNLFLGI